MFRFARDREESRHARYDGAHSIRRLLVGFDGSAASNCALSYAARVARHNRGCLVVVSVVANWPNVVGAPPFAVAVPAGADPEQLAHQRLRASVAQISPDIPVVTVVCRGRVGPILAREADRHICDAIVIGAPAGARSRLIGGLAHYLRRHSPTDVIIASARNRLTLLDTRLPASDPVTSRY